MGLTRCLGIMYMMIPLLLLRMTLAAPTFNRTVGEVQVGTCAGLKKNVEFGLDLTVIVTSDLLCAETITLSQGQDVSIVSEPPQQYAIAIAEDFPVPDPTSATLIVNPKSAYLSLEQLLIVNEAGSAGSPGAVRAISNAGSLDINACSFVGLNYATRQDGGAVSGCEIFTAVPSLHKRGKNMKQYPCTSIEPPLFREPFAPVSFMILVRVD